MQVSEIMDILESHKKWLKNETGGKKADFRYADFRGADFRYADFRYADFRGADLSYADFTNADFRGADFRYADLSYADFTNADLSYADFRGADFRGADFRYADFRYANLSYTDLSYTDLRYTDFRYANLSYTDLSSTDLRYTDFRYSILNNTDFSNANFDSTTAGLTSVCPQEGSFIAYKKASEKLVKLLIPEDALRSSATSRKCRCNKAKVLEIEGGIKEIASSYDKDFIYRVGEVVEVEDFDLNRWNECSTGVHFFIDKQEAINY